MSKTKTYHITLPKDVAETIEAEAEALDMREASYIRHLLLKAFRQLGWYGYHE